MASLTYNSAKVKLIDGNIDLDTDTLKVALVTSAYTPNQDTHDFFDDVTNQVTGTGYTAGGEALANKSVTQDNDGNRAVFDADDVVWANSTITARAAVLYKDTGSASTSPLIAYYDFTEDKISDAGNFTIQWHADDGLLTVGDPA